MPRALSFILILLLLPAVACGRNDNDDRPSTPTPSVAASPASPAGGSGRAPKADADPPSAGATPGRPPEPTPDPQRDAWTLLVYLTAGGDRAELALEDLDEMEAAGAAPGVNVLVQVGGLPVSDEDQPGDEADAQPLPAVRRYEIEADDEAGLLASPVVAEPGAIEMDDPGALADFIAWGVDRYPANRYALILVNRGGPRVPIAGIGEALAQAAEQTPAGRLDVVGYDAPLGTHLELFQAIQPHARFAAATAGPYPEQGWDYAAFLRALYEEVDLAPTALASLMAGAPSAALPAAVDLHALPAVVAALDDLTVTLEGDEALSLTAAALAAARREAPFVAPAAPAEIMPHSAVDLRRFAAVLAHRSPLRASAAAARHLMDALETAVLPGEGDVSERGYGLALSVPSHGGAPPEGSFGGWHRLMDRSFEAVAGTSPPQLHAAYGQEGAASVQQPVYLAAEIAGRRLADLAFVAGLPAADDRLRLVAYDLLVPERASLPDGALLHHWPDGIHERGIVWETTAGYLTNGESGDFVVLWPLAPGADARAVWGRYRPAGAEEWLEAALIVDEALILDEGAGEANVVWTYAGGDGESAPRRRTLRRGDAFQPYDLYLQVGGALLFEPGTVLSLDDGPLSFQRRPLPAGDARVGVVAVTMDGARTGTFVDLAIVNGDEAPDAVAYLDPDDGFRFLYPAGWPAPTSGDGVVRASDAAGETQLTVSRFPGVEVDAAPALKSAALERFGAVDILYEEPIFVAGDSGLLTAYGYESDGGARTGLFFTFVHQGDSAPEGTGYIVDVDGPTEQEPAIVATVQRLIESWTFQPVGAQQFPGEWTRLDAGPFSVAVPHDATHEILDNGWQRFSGEDAFISLRRDPSSGATRQDLLDRWLAVAARGVEQFVAADPTDVPLAGRLWARSDFEYQGRNGAVRGFVMAAIVGGEEIVAWAEAPAAAVLDEASSNETSLPEVEESGFLLLLADAASGIEGDSGLLYAAPFDILDAWGGGRQEGAAGTVEDGVYRLRVTAPEGFFWTSAGRTFGDGVYEVEVTHATGPQDNGFGLLFRADSAAGAYYAFEISSDGYVWIGRCNDGCAQMITLVGEGWTFSDAVHRGTGAANRLRVEASGSDLAFYVNGVEVGRVQDAALAEGDVGLFVETLGEGNVTVTFDNVRVTDF